MRKSRTLFFGGVVSGFVSLVMAVRTGGARRARALPGLPPGRAVRAFEGTGCSQASPENDAAPAPDGIETGGD
jgi:hypothetical protein